MSAVSRRRLRWLVHPDIGSIHAVRPGAETTKGYGSTHSRLAASLQAKRDIVVAKCGDQMFFSKSRPLCRMYLTCV
jgi:hypothetical protein